jgi:hypothetical protein
VYFCAADIALPWNPGYVLQNEQDPNLLPKAFVQTLNGEFTVPPGSGDQAQLGRFWVPIQFVGDANGPSAFVVKLAARVKKVANYFVLPGCFRLQPSRAEFIPPALTDFSGVSECPRE